MAATQVFRMDDYRKLRVYQDSRAILRSVFSLTRGFPRYRGRSATQLNDAADSIGSNIAEGCGRKDRNHGNTELIRYLHFSLGSANELQHRLSTARDREEISDADWSRVDADLEGLRHGLNAFIATLRRTDRGRR